MLAIDDLRKLADMQIRLLSITSNDRESNLKKYIELIIQIDENDYQKFLSNLEQVNTSNQSLEDELYFLKQISVDYNHLLHQQEEFRKNCEMNGYYDLKLSDLSVVNIDYVNSRIKNIDGNLKNNIELKKCKEELESLNKELLKEERSKELFHEQIIKLDSILRDSFLDAEGRILLNGQLQYISVVSEYKDLGFDIHSLLNNNDLLSKLLVSVNKELIDAEDKLKAAEFCYKNDSSDINSNILDEIRSETLKVRYKFSMLKILELLSFEVDDLNSFKTKREDLLRLINDRIKCLNNLSVNMKIDPFGRIKIYEQTKIIVPFEECLKNIDEIKKKISKFDALLDKLNSMSVEYMCQLRNKEDIIKSLVKEDILDSSLQIGNVSEIQVLDNQVVSIKDVTDGFNMSIVSQKTKKVIRRVNEMVNASKKAVVKKIVDDISPELIIIPNNTEDLNEDENLDNSFDFDNNKYVNEVAIDEVSTFNDINQENDNILDGGVIELDKEDEIFPKLTILSNNTEDLNEDENLDSPLEFDDKVADEKNIKVDIIDNAVVTDVKQDEINISDSVVVELEDRRETVDFKDEPLLFIDNVDSDIFMTVDPFIEMPLFNDRVEEEEIFFDEIVDDKKDEINDKDVSLDFMELQYDDNRILSIDNDQKIDDLKDEMPEAFWVVDGDENIVEDFDKNELSFDEQVDKLLADDKIKTKKLSV